MSIASLAFRFVASLLACLVFATLFPVLRATAMSLAHHAGKAFACAIGDNDSRSFGKSRRRSAGVPGHSSGAWKHASARTNARRSPRLARVNAAERADAITPGGFETPSRGPGSGPLASLSPRSTLARGVGDGEKRRGEGIGDASRDGSSGSPSSDGTASSDDEPVVGSTAAAASSGPTHLFVLVHGLGGAPEDLCCLERGILRRAGSSALVLKPGCNLLARSFDGVPNGAKRVAAEIQAVARAYEASLETVSLVGNSLGGIYARHAAAQLYDSQTRTIAGLVPDTYLTTATPHLGVGPFGYLGYFPSQIRALGAFAMGATTRQLLLLDGDDFDGFVEKNESKSKSGPLLLRMADPSSEYIAALGAFKRRCAYANATNDFLVAYETAALDPDAPETLRRRRARGARGTNLNGWGDDGDASPGGWGFPSPSPSPLGGFGGSARIVDERLTRPTTEDAKAGGAFWRARSASRAATKTKNRRSSLGTQRAIAAGLRTLEWFHVDVEFPGMAPLAHNKICALQRDPVMKFLFKEGEWVVEHQAEYLTGRRK
jgi:hypothetical protein